MAVSTGCDIVCISRFRERLMEAGADFAETVFLPAELRDRSPRHLAGIFAAKEAVTKALSMRPGHWLNIAIEQAPTGAPRVVLAQSPPTLEDIGISISHDGDYALAFAVALLR